MFTEYLYPQSVEEAFNLLEQSAGSARLVAGGTDLALHPPAEVSTLLDLSRLDLQAITSDEDGFHIGAAATLTDVAGYGPFSEVWSGVLTAMLAQVASPLHRNVASIGGHLARGRLSDVVPVLLAIDAQVRFYEGEYRRMDLSEFYRTRRNRSPLVITGVDLSADTGRAAFRKFARTTYDLAILNVACAVRLDGDTVSWARVVVGERPTLAVELPEASSVLLGAQLEPDTISAAARAASQSVEVRSDPRGSAEYRRHLTEVLVRRCLTEVAGQVVYA